MILAAQAWKTNADLITDVHSLGLLRDEDLTLDPTYGGGLWWTKWRPKRLIRNSDYWDFRAAPFKDSCFDAVAYDPPYVAKGGRDTSGTPDMDARYGMYDCPPTPKLLQELINDGLTEMVRVTKAGGVVLVKCQTYVSSGKLWLGTHHTLTHALELGCEVEGIFQHISTGDGGPQPRGRRQVHARNNYSTLYALKVH